MMVAPRVAHRRTRRARVRAGVLLGGMALAALAWAAGQAARPAGPGSWAGPAPGGVWAPTSLALQTNALVAEPQRPAVVFAGATDGVWRSGDGGAHWARAWRGLRGAAIVALAATVAGDTLFAGSEDGAVYARGLRGDGSWRRVSPALGANPVFSLAVSPDGQRTVLAGTVGGLYRGAVYGSGWRWRRVARTGAAAVSSIVWSPTNARIAFAGVFGVRPPVLSTHDGGRTWRAADAGLPSVLPTQALLAPATRRPQVILTTMGGGVWERSMAGPWRDISAGLPERHAMPLVALPGSGAVVLYAGTMGDGVYVKQGGAAWRRLGRGLMGESNTILAMGVAAGPHPALLAGTASGVFRYVALR